MIAALLVAVAHAESYKATSETTVQGRMDDLGTPYVAGWETLWGRGGALFFQGEVAADVAFPHGFDQPLDWNLYVLTADGHTGRIDWTLGRQRMNVPSTGWDLDGGRIGYNANPYLRLEAWAGQAEHMGLASWTDGVPVARLSATVNAGPVHAVLGALGEAGDNPALHPDLQVTLADKRSKLAPSLNLLLIGGFDSEGASALEKGRLFLSARPVAGTRLTLWGEHREATNETSTLAPLILANIAPLGYDEVGAGFGWTSATTSTLWTEGSVQSYAPDPDDEPYREVGWTASAAWTPHCGADTWCVSPSWRAAAGPGGAYHAFLADIAVPTPGLFTTHVTATVAPYTLPHEAWDTLFALGAVVSASPVPHLTGTLGGELAHDAIHPVDPRVWLSLRVAVP